MSNGFIGRCSCCGGDVYRPMVTYVGDPPLGVCSRCGQKEARGPVIQMGGGVSSLMPLPQQQSLLYAAGGRCEHLNNGSLNMASSVISRVEGVR